MMQFYYFNYYYQSQLQNKKCNSVKTLNFITIMPFFLFPKRSIGPVGICIAGLDWENF